MDYKSIENRIIIHDLKTENEKLKERDLINRLSMINYIEKLNAFIQDENQKRNRIAMKRQ